MPYKLLLSLFMMMAMSALSLQAQTYPGARLVTCDRRNINVAELFNIICSQTSMQAFYNEEQISSFENIPVVKFNNEPLDNVLAWLLRKRGMGWCYRKKTLVVSYKKPGDADLGVIPHEEETGKVTGIVVNEKMQPIQGVAVMVRDSLKGVSTDSSGRFTLTGLMERPGLSVRKAGYKPMELVSYADSVYVQLIPMVAPLQPVNVNGVAAKPLTGTVVQVKKQQIAYQPVNNVLGALQGQVPGLHISQTTGLPGGGYKIRLRGKNSIESVSDPLVLIDGMPLPTVAFNESFINQYRNRADPRNVGIANPPPQLAAFTVNDIGAGALNLLTVNDIADIKILKDADATAMYGSKGANGIIMITSKTPGPVNRDWIVNVYTGAGIAANMMRFLNAQQYVQMRKEALRNDGVPTDQIPDDAYDLKRWDTTGKHNTDWQKEMIGGRAKIQEAGVEKSGGAKGFYYRASGMYRRETTVYPSLPAGLASYGSDNFKYQKYGLQGQLNYTIPNQKLKFALAGNYIGDQSVMPTIDLTSLAITPPNTPDVLTKEKNLNFENSFDNPYAYLLRTSNVTSRNLRIYANTTYEPIKDLVFSANGGYSRFKIDEVQINPSKSFDSSYHIKGLSYFYDSRYTTGLLNLQGSWARSVGAGVLKVLFGARFQNDKQQLEGNEGSEYENDGFLKEFDSAGKKTPLEKIDTNYYYQSFYSRFEYKHNDKYILTFTISRDGSSRVSEQYRYATFGATGLAWIFSREKWFNGLKWLSYGKLGISGGISGNDQYMKNVDRNTYIPWNVLNPKPTTKYTPALLYDWEKILKSEIMLDLGFLNDRILTTFSYYNNRSSRQLLTAKYYMYGMEKTSPVNYPAIVKNRGVEIDVITTPVQSDKVTWTSTFNISFPTNKLVEFPRIERTNYREYYSVGLSLDMVQAYQLSGLDKDGIYYFVNKSGQGPKREEDYIYGRELGPDFYGGFQNSIAYKGFELNCLFRFAKQNNYNLLYRYSAPGTVGTNQLLPVLGRWREPGDHTAIQKFTTDINSAAGIAFGFAQESDQRISDASYLRLQSIMLAYNLPLKKISGVKGRSCKLYVQGMNLFTITGFKGRDPEIVTDLNTYPSVRIITTGMQFSF